MTSIRLGGPANRVVSARSADELIEVVSDADRQGEPVLLIGGGSNMIVADAGWPGVAVQVQTLGISWSVAQSQVRIAAGEPWDQFATSTGQDGWCGLETMVGIPGRVGAMPVQNVGAYGAETTNTLVSLQVLDRRNGSVASWSRSQCDFGLRDSAFKHTDRYVILDVTFQLRRSGLSLPVLHAELAQTLGIELGATAPISEVQAAVLNLRRRKGMLLDAADHDTWSVGSFFINPLLSNSSIIPHGCPRWTVPGGTKVSAAWLIENAGFGRGFGLASGSGQVSVSTKHCLALTNRGHATTDELIRLAREIRQGVQRRFAITLEPEARLVGVEL